jgi:hypothetical protein
MVLDNRLKGKRGGLREGSDLWCATETESKVSVLVKRADARAEQSVVCSR